MEHRRFAHGTTDSTNERAFAALAAGDALHGDVHVAAAQTAGRGSRGREWLSAPGDGLYASVVWMPRAVASPAVLTMAAGLAVRDALLELGLAAARLKWPNDVLVGEEKLAGILIESRGLDAARPAFVCGIGVNVGRRAFPDGLRRPATSLALHGIGVAPDELLERLLPHLDARFAQVANEPDALADDFQSAARIAGALRVRLGDETVEGELARFGLDGIELATPAGTRTIALEHATAVERPDPER